MTKKQNIVIFFLAVILVNSHAEIVETTIGTPTPAPAPAPGPAPTPAPAPAPTIASDSTPTNPATPNTPTTPASPTTPTTPTTPAAPETPATPATPTPVTPNPTDGTTEGSLKPEECDPRCEARCSKTHHKKPCLFFCKKCCATCLCVPAGTYGNKETCPCYNNWKTQEGGPKCP